MSETRYLFIDGANFRKQLEVISKVYFGSITLPIDLMKMGASYRKTFYYDCLPPIKKGESTEDYEPRCELVQNEFDAMREVPGVHVITGVVIGAAGRNRQKTS